MRKVYKSDFGTLACLVFGILLFSAMSAVAFNFEPKPVVALTGIFLVTFFSYGLLMMLKYNVIITDDAITAKQTAFWLFNKYRTFRFDEIEEVHNAIFPFSEYVWIVFKSRDRSKKPMSIMINFGLPWDALVDIMNRLPKDVKINFEPLLWKQLKKPFLDVKVRRRNEVYGTIIILMILWLIYYFWSFFYRNHILFPFARIVGAVNK